MKKIIRHIFLVFFIFILSSCLHAEEIKIGYFEVAPHISFKNGKPSGALVDYWEDFLASKMNLTIRWIGPLPFKRMLHMLETGEINCVPIMALTLKRKEKFAYPTLPFDTVVAGVVVPINSKLKGNFSADLLKGLQIGYFNAGYLPPYFKNENFNWAILHSANWRASNLKKLLSGRIAAILDLDHRVLEYGLLRDKPYSSDLRIVKFPQFQTKVYSTFSKLDNGKFLRKYNLIHSRILKNNKGLYKRLFEHYFIPKKLIKSQ